MAAQPFVGQIQAFGFQYNPSGWVPCDGRSLPVSEYTILYTLIGTTYGGNGNSSFNVPDLRGRVPIGMGTGAGLTTRICGQPGGSESITLLTSQMPAHTHILTATGGNFMVSGQPGISPTPGGANNTIGALNDAGTSTNNAYNNITPDIVLNTGANFTASVSSTGGNLPFEILEPYQVVNYCIAAEGIFPQRG